MHFKGLKTPKTKWEKIRETPCILSAIEFIVRFLGVSFHISVLLHPVGVVVLGPVAACLRPAGLAAGDPGTRRAVIVAARLVDRARLVRDPVLRHPLVGHARVPAVAAVHRAAADQDLRWNFNKMVVR